MEMVSIQDEIETLTTHEKVLLTCSGVSIEKDPKDKHGVIIKVNRIAIKVAVYPECDSESICFNTNIGVIEGD